MFRFVSDECMIEYHEVEWYRVRCIIWPSVSMEHGSLEAEGFLFHRNALCGQIFSGRRIWK